MSAIHALLGFVGVTLVLVAGTFGYRGLRFLQGSPINAWKRGEKNEKDAEIAKRIADAHANCIENLPVFAVLVLGAAALGKLPVIDGLAPYVLYARIGQAAAHLSGTGQPNVLVRATFWSAQLGLFVWMLVKLF